MKALLSTLIWLGATTGFILSCIAYTQGLIVIPERTEPIAQDLEDRVQIANAQVAGATTTDSVTSDTIETTTIIPGDARVALVHNFLERYNSPLLNEENFANTLVEIADEHEIDFRLLPSIAMQESTLCKATPENSYNCLGLGVHSQGTWRFESYEDNFKAAARILKENYIDIGLTTPEQIMRKYTPSSNGSWAASVNQWMAEMRYDDRQMGRTMREDANLLEFTATTSSETKASAIDEETE
ncbi:MAG: hypothetical protein WDZ94_04185 [Patescibacteria group bacterium]